jgi:hypothetical protein
MGGWWHAYVAVVMNFVKIKEKNFEHRNGILGEGPQEHPKNNYKSGMEKLEKNGQKTILERLGSKN